MSNSPPRPVSFVRPPRPPMLRSAAALLVLLAASGVQAQGQNDHGSIYSRYGLGERSEFASSQAAMLGHAGASLRSSVYTNLSNPALWSDQLLTTFSAAARVTTVRGVDGVSPDASVGTAGDVAGLLIGLPIYPGRLGLVVSYQPYSRVNYRSTTAGTLDADDGPVGYTLDLEGGGGLQQIGAGLGLRVGSALQLGARADVVLGTQEALQRTTFDTTATVYSPTRQARSTRVSGVTATLGGAASARALLRDDDALTVGAAVTLPTALSVERATTLGSSLDRDTLTTTTGGDATLPLTLRGGLTYRSGPRWLATTEVLYEPWGGFESTVPVGGFDPAAGLDALRDRLRVGGGVEVSPGGRRSVARTALRLGGYAERGLYAPDGRDVSTYAVTGGVSVPNRLTGARIDLGFELGTRGSTEGVLVRDTFVKGTLTLNFGERWFVRRRFN